MTFIALTKIYILLLRIERNRKECKSFTQGAQRKFGILCGKKI